MSESITLTVEIDPTEFDEPREMTYERLVEAFGPFDRGVVR